MRAAFYLTVALALASCDTATESDGSTINPGLSAGDPTVTLGGGSCFSDASKSCHGRPTFGAVPPDWDVNKMWNCRITDPQCLPRPLLASERQSILAALTNHVRLTDSQCLNAKNYIVQQLNIGLIFAFDWYPTGNVVADIHGFGLTGEIHIRSDMFSAFSFAVTLMHEAAHGYYGISSDAVAQSFGLGCFR